MPNFVNMRQKVSEISAVENLCYRKKVDQSSPKSLKTCNAQMPLIMPNFIVFGQTMYDKSVTAFYTLHYFGAPGDSLDPW